jgi:hypothetical protein
MNSGQMPSKQPKKLATGNGPLLQLPEGQPRAIEPSCLLLDPHNLRLLERAEPSFWNAPAKLIGQSALQEKITEVLSQDDGFDVKGLVTSILNNGFLKHELMIVAPYDATTYLVLEGNRRLAAVRTIIKAKTEKLNGVLPSIVESLQTLPCFVLSGEPIGGDEARLAQYRRASEIYIGMRHLMGAKSWEPASRYEFEANLVMRDGWSPTQVADRFGREKSHVLRDLKAQRLYQNFRQYEKKNSITHKLTYNAFAQAARAKVIMDWLEWSDEDYEIGSLTHQRVFFNYLISRVGSKVRAEAQNEDEVTPEQSSELVVKQFREMLKLDDDLVTGALEDGEFERAELLFHERREGAFTSRVSSYVRGLRRVTTEELSQNPKQIRAALIELTKEVEKVLRMVDGFLRK